MTWLDLLLPLHCAGCDSPATARLCARCARGPARRIEAPAEGVRWAFALAPYDGGTAAALRRAKYGPDRALARWLSGHLADHAAAVAVGFDALVPVPSPWTRRAARGFACSALFARALSRRSGVPLVDALTLAPGPRQAGLARAGRRSNLAGRMRSIQPVPGRVLLVDDVLTTGATLGAAARELLGASSDEVAAVVLCAATPPRENR